MAQTPRLSLPRAADRIGILSFEHAKIRQQQGILTAATAEWTYEIPTAQLTAILAGPGTSITHDAATLLADNGVTLLWTGSGGIRAYSTITPLATQADLLHRQITRWAKPTTRLETALIAYRRRFTNDPAEYTTLTELRAAEGRRVKRLYRQLADEHGITWPGRTPQWHAADPLNRAITAVYHCYYGAAANIIAALGCHHALGFIHTGKRDAFTYDIADLHKISLGLPLAFNHAIDGATDSALRSAVNTQLRQHHVLARMVDDIYALLAIADQPEVNLLYLDTLHLYDPNGDMPARTNYADEPVNW